MLYLFGPSEDSTTRYFAREAGALGANVRWVDITSATHAGWLVELGGQIELGTGLGRRVVPAGAPAYARLITTGADSGGDAESTSRRLLTALMSWLELSSGRVVNRPGYAIDNGSKPLHEALLTRAGFLVPASTTSSDPRKLRSFAQKHSSVVKTISGIRADCIRIDAADLDDFHPEQGPIHLQRAIDGLDVRVHVVGTRAIAVAIRSRAADYRMDDDAHYFPYELPSDLVSRVVRATAEMGLAFAGWDFKRADDDGRFYALEANPMPGYQVYDRAVDREITHALVEYLEAPQ